ncbi:MAG TPA: YceI family protein [Dyella sp.]|nr:YceI family protein [Dyella sp.]
MTVGLRISRKQPWWRTASLLLLSLPLLAAANGTDYRIDPDTSEAVFRVRLFWVDNVNGHFTHVDGDVSPGPNPGSLVVDASVPVESVAMPTRRMRQWVLAPAFFDAGHHPIIHFVSNPVTQSDLQRGGTLTGYLTLRGVTAPIQFTVDPAQCQPLTIPSCKIVLRGILHRSTFGMTSDRLAISDNVDLNLSITLQRETR